MPLTLKHPPETKTSEGHVRRVGVEMEFGGMSTEQAAAIVQEVFGGVAERNSEHLYTVETDGIGTFKVELDTKFAHPSKALESSFGEGSLVVAADRALSRTIGNVALAMVPVEIVAPPIPYTELSKLSALTNALRRYGAEGTESTIIAAYGLHLNPEAASFDTESLLNTLKAYIISSPKLRDAINVNFTRELLPYVDPFPDNYIRRVLDQSYTPDRDSLIDDYLTHNPTRNRELDLLPLFKHLDEKRVLNAVGDARVNERPTFHYRLPSMYLEDTSWSVVTEWNRWVEVEQLAANTSDLQQSAADFLDEMEENKGLLESAVQRLKP